MFNASASELTRVFYVQTHFQRKLFQCLTSTSLEGALSDYKQREDSAAADSCELCERRVI